MNQPIPDINEIWPTPAAVQEDVSVLSQKAETARDDLERARRTLEHAEARRREEVFRAMREADEKLAAQKQSAFEARRAELIRDFSTPAEREQHDANVVLLEQIRRLHTHSQRGFPHSVEIFPHALMNRLAALHAATVEWSEFWDQLASGMLDLEAFEASAPRSVIVLPNDVETADDHLVVFASHRRVHEFTAADGTLYRLPPVACVSPEVWAQIGEQIRSTVDALERHAAQRGNAFVRAHHDWFEGAWILPQIGRLSLSEIAERYAPPIGRLFGAVGVRLAWRFVQLLGGTPTSELAETLFKNPIDDRSMVARDPVDRPDLAAWWAAQLGPQPGNADREEAAQ